MSTPIVPVVPADILEDDTLLIPHPPTSPTPPDDEPAQTLPDLPEPSPEDVDAFEEALDGAEDRAEEETLTDEEHHLRQNPNRSAA